MDKAVLVGKLVAEQWRPVMAEQSDSQSFVELLELEGTVDADEPGAGDMLVQPGDRADQAVDKVGPGDKERKVVAELVEELGDKLAELVAGLAVEQVIPNESF